MLENNDIPQENDKNHVSVGRVGLVYCSICLKYHKGKCLVKKGKRQKDEDYKYPMSSFMEEL